MTNVLGPLKVPLLRTSVGTDRLKVPFTDVNTPFINFSSGLSNQNISSATALVRFRVGSSPSSTCPTTWKLNPATIVEGIESTLRLDST